MSNPEGWWENDFYRFLTDLVTQAYLSGLDRNAVQVFYHHGPSNIEVTAYRGLADGTRDFIFWFEHTLGTLKNKGIRDVTVVSEFDFGRRHPDLGDQDSYLQLTHFRFGTGKYPVLTLLAGLKHEEDPQMAEGELMLTEWVPRSVAFTDELHRTLSEQSQLNLQQLYP